MCSSEADMMQENIPSRDANENDRDLSIKGLLDLRRVLFMPASAASIDIASDYVEDRVPKTRLNPVDDDLHLLVCLLESAKVSLKICMYNANDGLLVKLLKKLRRIGVEVTFVRCGSISALSGKDFLVQLMKEGVDVISMPTPTDSDERRASGMGQMHHKYAIIDDAVVVTGSMNWTDASLKNVETLAVFDDPKVVQEYLEDFSRVLGVLFERNHSAAESAVQRLKETSDVKHCGA